MNIRAEVADLGLPAVVLANVASMELIGASLQVQQTRSVTTRDKSGETGTESLSGGNPGVKSACLPADDRGFVEARSTPSTHSDFKFEMAGEPGAIQRVAGNAEVKTRDSADRRSPDGPLEHAVAGRE